MARTLVREPFHLDGWVYEEKVDGWRIIAYKDDAHVRLVRGNYMRSTLTSLAALLLLAGCSSAATLRPEPIHTELAPISWPSNAVKIVVEDRRTDRTESAALADAIERTLRNALAPARPAPCPCFTLTTAVIEHRGFFGGGGSSFWHGLTSIQATLADDTGREVYRFRAEDHDEEWNAFGESSGTTAAQKSLRDALSKLVRQMAQRDLPPATATGTAR
jgi:hypothetical protein